MSSGLVLFILLAYFGILILISYFTSRKSDNETFFTANRTSPWYLVAFGMIGTSLSGVTFISIPGEVGNSNWTYLPVVMGNCIGYVVIALVLLPLFYKLNLVSIYSWLGKSPFDRIVFLYFISVGRRFVSFVLSGWSIAIGFIRQSGNSICFDGIYYLRISVDIHFSGWYKNDCLDGYLTNGFYADFGGFDYCRHLSGAGSEF